jgi:hypothetical protein
MTLAEGHVLVGWQGFLFSVPKRFAPTRFSGTKAHGDLLFSDARDTDIHIRWLSAKGSTSLEGPVNSLLNRLRKDAKSAKRPLQSESRQHGDAVGYSWSDRVKASGLCFAAPNSGRTVLIEVRSPSSASSGTILEALRKPFEDQVGALELWSVMGLEVRVPSALSLTECRIETGWVRLAFANKRRFAVGPTALAADRWGTWRFPQDSPILAVEFDETGCHESMRTTPILRLTTKTLLRHEPEEQRLTRLQVRYRREEDEPQWGWLKPCAAQ